jgi:hypothetical protein
MIFDRDLLASLKLLDELSVMDALGVPWKY